TGTPPDGVVGQPYEHTFTVTGTPAPTVTVTDGALPDGLRLSEQGVLSGTPTTTGPHAFTVTASNGFGENAVREATLEVGQPPAITGTPPDGVVGQPYEHTFTVTGTPAPTVTVTDGAVPYGLTLSEQGVLSGTPPIAATYNFTVTVSNGFGDDAVLPVVVDIAETPSTMSSGSLESSGS
ncbi:putative Ig domain-containing protein, partial [Rhodococcus sp. NPDC049939]|uniref:putative Ig domain-containing protein n=1 Tax=Rhodococcus sp. NPDC049939 TaxID=3155511 RepID=UPI0033ED85A1